MLSDMKSPKCDVNFFAVEYSILAAVIGFFKSFTTGNAVALSIELVGPVRALNLYVVKCLVDGIGIAGMPLIAGNPNKNTF